MLSFHIFSLFRHNNILVRIGQRPNTCQIWAEREREKRVELDEVQIIQICFILGNHHSVKFKAK
jgi:hypothetical protein